MIESLNNKHRMVNSSLAHRVIELHDDGYELDFRLAGEREIVCLQDNRKFGFRDVLVKIIDQVFDYMSNTYKYVHTIDTCCGCKGLLVIESIVIPDESLAQHLTETYFRSQLSA
ncbi:MAG: hypothetical protein JST50_15930 [Bacteroidetes bacterium]|jgi:hypothetical protein|nr:hypothetical protein [Bacteroidota bacterium]